MTIKAIIFDLGGVLLRTADFSPREKLAASLNMDRHELEDFIFCGDSGDKAQKGEISVSQHWENLRYQINYTPQEFKTLLDKFFSQDSLDEDLVSYIRTLHKTYKTALLTNAWEGIRQTIASTWHLEDIFDVMIISSEVKLVKPDPKIFQMALDRLSVEANETIFIDDFQRNVDAAKSIGMNAIRFRNLNQIRDELELLLNSR